MTTKPDPIDPDAVAEFLAEEGYVEYSPDELKPWRFADWRREVKEAAHARAMRVSIRETMNKVQAIWPGFQQPTRLT